MLSPALKPFGHQILATLPHERAALHTTNEGTLFALTNLIADDDGTWFTLTNLIADDDGKWFSAGFDAAAAAVIPVLLVAVLFGFFRLLKLFANAF